MNKHNRSRRGGSLSAFAVLAFIAALISVILVSCGTDVPTETEADGPLVNPSAVVVSTETETITEAESTTEEITQTDIPEPVSLPPEEETEAETAETVEEITEPYVPVLYDFAEPVPETDAVPFEYFNDTVFIGDSRTQGLIMYTNIFPKYNFAAQSANINTLRHSSYVVLKDEDGKNVKYTVIEALEREKGNYSAIYISTGLNELGWSVNRYISEYEQFIDSIRGVTYAPIYIQLVCPITTAYEELTGWALTNAKAAVFNERLRLMAEEKQVFVLDPTSLHTLEDGSLDPQYTYDGAHLFREPYNDIIEYYRTHTVDITAFDNIPKEPEPEDIPVEIPEEAETEADTKAEDTDDDTSESSEDTSN